jgi:hypothetical protein
VPVAQSDPRRATIVGIVGVVVGTLLIVGVLIINNVDRGSSSTGTTTNHSTSFSPGPAKSLAAAVANDKTPLFFQDPATFQRPIVVQHTGADPATGWTAFDAAVGTCVITWHVEAQNFTDCNGVVFPADGTGRHAYAVTVDKDGNLQIDLSG